MLSDRKRLKADEWLKVCDSLSTAHAVCEFAFVFFSVGQFVCDIG